MLPLYSRSRVGLSIEQCRNPLRGHCPVALLQPQLQDVEGTRSPCANDAVIQPLRASPYPVGSVNGRSRATCADEGSFTERLRPSSRLRKRNALPRTFRVRCPQGKSSVVSGYPRPCARSAFSAAASGSGRAAFLIML